MSKLGTKRGRDTVDFWTDPTLLEEYTTALNELAGAQEAAKRDSRLVNTKLPAAQKKVKEIAKRAEADMVVFTIQALPRKRWAELQAEFPARKDNELDEQFGANAEDLVDAVLSEPGVILSVTNKATGEAVDFTAEDWRAESAELSHGQWEPFARSVLLLNNGNPTPDFKWAASLGTKSSAAK